MTSNTPQGQEQSYQVTVEPSHRHFAVNAGETILEAAIRQEVGLPYGCKNGACGACVCKKLLGEITHGDYAEHALSPSEAQSGMILACRAYVHSDVVIENEDVVQESAFPVQKMPARVRQMQRVAPDVMRVHVQLPPAEKFAYHAGQFVEFVLEGGARRAYSIANAPYTQEDGAGLELHIRHMPGGRFTDHVFGGMKEKDILRLEGPFGSFYLREGHGKPIILLASGTGMAPVRAILQHLRRQKSTLPVHIYWGVRRPHDLYEHAWLQEQAAAMPQWKYVPVVSDALPQDPWQGRRGLVHQAVLDDLSSLAGFEVYACGSPLMLDAAQKSFVAERGLPQDAFYSDAFTAAVDGQ